MANITLNPSSQGSGADSGPILTGLGFKLLIREESSYGELWDTTLSNSNSSFDDFEDYIIELLPGGLLSKRRNLISTSNNVQTGSISEHEFIAGTENVSGSYSFPLTHEHMELIFTHTLGSETVLGDANGGGPGLGFLEIYTGALPGTSPTASNSGGAFYTYYSGNRITSFTFDCPSRDSYVVCKANIIGKDEQLLGIPSSEFNVANTNYYGLYATQEETVKTNFPCWAMELHLDDGSNKFRVPFYNFSLTVDNGFVSNNFIQGGSTNKKNTVNLVKGRKRNISGNFTMPFFHGTNTNSTKQFISGYLATEKFALEVVFNNEEETKVFRITCPNISFFDGTSPSAINFSEASCNMSFKAFMNNDTEHTELAIAYT